MKEEKTKACPACGTKVPTDAQQCPVCGLEGVNRLFLSKAGYEKWVKEVLQPHLSGMMQVFAGDDYGLILNGKGELYGIGKNFTNNIGKKAPFRVEEPWLIAKDVISAAAGSWYTIYVTQDGKVHLLGSGILAEDFAGFSGAKRVFANSRSQFWIVDENNKVWTFGKNDDGSLAPRKKELWCTYPEESYNISYKGYTEEEYSQYNYVLTGSIVWWKKDGKKTWSVEANIREKKAYQDLVKKHGHGNVEIVLNEKRIGSGVREDGYDYADQCVCRPELYVTNDYIYKPFLRGQDQWMAQSLHRCGSLPIRLDQGNLPDENAKVVKSRMTGSTFWTKKDGVILSSCNGGKWEPLEWLKGAAVDISVGEDFCMIACANGDILWSKDVVDMMRGTMKVCRLPEGN